MSLVNTKPAQRGLTLPEVMISGFIMLGIVFVLTTFARMNNVFWQQGVADNGAQTDAQQAVQKLAPFIREARAVVVGSSSPTQVTLQMPRYDADGNLVIPQEDGQVLSFYLSDQTGVVGRPGTVLWRSADGTPDTLWSMGASRGRVVLVSLGFTYEPAAEPESVTVSVTAEKEVGTSTQRFVTSQEVVMRNKIDEGKD